MLLNQWLPWILIIIFVWLGTLSFFLYQGIRRLKKLTFGSSKENLVGVLEKILKDQEKDEKDIKEISGRINEIEDKSKIFVQRMGLVRFNPFPETGGDQSFTLAVLDGTKSGVIISSLHSRANTRIYAKPVKGGKIEEYQFSKEEAQAIEKASK